MTLISTVWFNCRVLACQLRKHWFFGGKPFVIYPTTSFVKITDMASDTTMVWKVVEKIINPCPVQSLSRTQVDLKTRMGVHSNSLAPSTSLNILLKSTVSLLIPTRSRISLNGAKPNITILPVPLFGNSLTRNMASRRETAWAKVKVSAILTGQCTFSGTPTCNLGIQLKLDVLFCWPYRYFEASYKLTHQADTAGPTNTSWCMMKRLRYTLTYHVCDSQVFSLCALRCVTARDICV